MSEEALVIVGLGNPGKEYAATRHNFGWRVVEAFARDEGMTFKEEKKFQGHVAKGEVDGQSVYLLLPTTYMNESGVAVSQLCRFYKLGAKELVVVVDDAALPFGQMRLRATGSAGGHNGLKSIERHMGTREYLRLRLGIDQGRQEMTDHVLSRFTKEEQEELPKIEQKACEALKKLLRSKPEEVMNLVNPKLEKKNEAKAEEKPL